MTTSEQAPAEVSEATIDRFWETVPPVWNRIRGTVRGIASGRHGLGVEQFHVLRHLRAGVSSVSALAEARQISPPAVSQAVDILVERGLVARSRDEEDRRCVRLELTPRGNRLLAGIFARNRLWMKERLAGLDTADHECIRRALGLLGKAFDEKAS